MIKTIAAVLATLALAGCQTAKTQGTIDLINAFRQTNCHVGGTITAQVGALNPGSGATLTATVDCPNGQGPNANTPAPAATGGATNTAAPS